MKKIKTLSDGKRIIIHEVQPIEKLKEHIRDLAHRALQIATENKLATGVYPPPDYMFYHLCLVMVSLEEGVTAETITENMTFYRKKMAGAGNAVFFLNKAQPFIIPEGFPYTIEEMHQSMMIE